MMPYKLDPTCAYSDTDSVFTQDSLGIIKTGSELGLFKDELSGEYITEATFLDIKQYGYKYHNGDKAIEKSIFAGVTRDSLTYGDILKLQEQGSMELGFTTRFFKFIYLKN